jgi:hypothetical protein
LLPLTGRDLPYVLLVCIAVVFLAIGRRLRRREIDES